LGKPQKFSRYFDATDLFSSSQKKMATMNDHDGGITVGALVRINENAKGRQLLDGFEGRLGRVSHLVAGEGSHKPDPLWVVAVARSDYTRKLLFSNATKSIDESTCSWLPIPQSCLELLDDDDNDNTTEDDADHNKKRRIDGITEKLAHIPKVTSQVLQHYRRNKEQQGHNNGSGIPLSNHQKLPSVCVIVCFRDLHSEQKRGEHLAKFVPHMITFFNKGINHGLCARYRCLSPREREREREHS